MKAENTARPKRNRSFEETHRNMIETAVHMIAERGVDALSIAALAREMGINRTTVYYHFDSREQLIEEVKAWSSAQLSEAFNLEKSRQERIEHIYRFVLENPQLLKLWMDDLMAKGDIRRIYPHWDEMVNGIREQFRGSEYEEAVDPEVFCVNLLTSAFMGPRIFKSSVCPDADIETVVRRFETETIRVLKSLSLV